MQSAFVQSCAESTMYLGQVYIIDIHVHKIKTLI